MDPVSEEAVTHGVTKLDNRVVSRLSTLKRQSEGQREWTLIRANKKTRRRSNCTCTQIDSDFNQPLEVPLADNFLAQGDLVAVAIPRDDQRAGSKHEWDL